MASGKTLVLYQGYTFSYKGPKDVKLYLYCSRKDSVKCSARLKLDKAGRIVLALAEHNHNPPILSRTKNELSDFRGYKMIRMVGGKDLILFQNYTFSYQGPKDVKLYPYCSKKSSGKCQARLKLDKAGNIVFVNNDHNHPPPRLTKCSSGVYIKID